MKTQLFLSHLYSLDDMGFLSRSLADTLSNNTIIKAVPDFTAVSDIDEIFEEKLNETSDNIKTIIQYLDTNLIEYHSAYKNIVIFHDKHYVRRNRSLLSKLSFGDEFWVFDEQNLQFLLDYKISSKKIKIVGFPYSHHRLPLPKVIPPSSTSNFLTVTDIFGIENVESLIFNFLLLFHDQNNIKFNVYIKCFKSSDLNFYETLFNDLLTRVKSNLFLTTTKNIESLIKITVANPYEDYENYINLQVNNHCYINLDNTIQPDVITAFRFNKYLLSICDIGNILYFNPENIIDTTNCNYRRTFNESGYLQHYINEYNLYPKINDTSIQSLLISTLKELKNNKKMSYKQVNRKGFYDHSF